MKGKIMNATTDQAIDTYRAADRALRAGREEWRLAEIALQGGRDAALRRVVGTRRGGVVQAARALGVSDAQILRMLDDGITRAVRVSLDGADVERSDYELTRQRGGRSIGVVLTTDSGPSDEMIIHVLEQAGLHLVERRPISTATTDVLRWKALKEVKTAAKVALDEADISTRIYRLVERRGDQVVRLTFTPIMDGLTDSTRERFTQILRDAGLTVQVEQGNPGTLLIGVAESKDDESVTQELLFTWADQE